ncbi:hypothetical protein N7481_001338 [Penicillium waksmanii]|uniref:uncharacterized protein n=1 Tax=Penicillium waksmanii TaxID=69791 RepID=UPI002548B1E6|nr:uncharacterized protein N7481_001338 [Penicillium waksmanii]KAJ6000929.1 hypothetical protein N7481_001338 [Penicillium waksmanii]
MVEPELQHAHRLSADKQIVSKAEIPLKERFFPYFQREITALQEKMDGFAHESLVDSERAEVTDHCLAGIVWLSNEVNDAASYIPTYGQRVYAEVRRVNNITAWGSCSYLVKAIKALQEKLNETRTVFEPQSQLSFKTKQNAPSISLSDVATLATEGCRSIPGDRSPEHSIIVVSCRQFHMHNCTDDDVYISCSSNPIIEECSNVRLGRIPKAYALNHDHLDNQDHWNEVEDFKWIRPEPSRNWSLLGPGDVVPEEVWAEIVPGGPGWSLEDILHAIRLVKT